MYITIRCIAVDPKYSEKKWPTKAQRCPLVGEMVESKDGDTFLPVSSIRHCEDNSGVPFVKVFLSK